MKKMLTLSAALLFAGITQAQSTAEMLHYKVDLNKVSNDELTIELTVPQMKDDKVSFHMPKMVPGTYSIYDFGRFASNFKAFNAEGKELSVKKNER
jgi:predicted metalloprotease with PDZ domain